MKKIGFALVELLIVIAVISLLAAILFPVFFTARARARQTACLSNMRQIGLAIALYAQDNDDLYPYGTDPSDEYTPIWNGTPYAAQVAAMPPLQTVLDPYIKSHDLWRCPSDTGYDIVDMTAYQGAPVPLNARPTSYQQFGTSYLFRTELALRQIPYGTADGFEPQPPYTEHGPSDLNVLMDGNGSWHGGLAVSQKRYNVLMADGHMVNQDIAQFYRSWSLQLEPGP